MSSSNSVRVTFIEETVYGTTPGVGNFSTARFTSESLSASPQVTESAQIRVDRMSSGQIVTGLEVGGELNFELAKESALDLFLKSLMHNEWVTDTPVNADLSIDATLKTLTRAAGNFNTDGVRVGDILTLTGFSNPENNTNVMVTSINSVTELGIIGPADIVTESDTGNTFVIADYLEIGTTQKSFSMEKAFLDLTDKALIYKGMMVNTMSVNFAYGELATGTIGFNGAEYLSANSSSEFITYGRTINSAATTNSLNGSVDMPFIANSADGSFGDTNFCIQSVGLEINNNMFVQNCIGQISPESYGSGTCQISVNLSAYLADGTWDILEAKLQQTPFSIGFLVKNSGGGYGFYLPAVQVSFDDPSSGGANQDVVLDMSGVAKVGAAGESAIRIFRL